MSERERILRALERFDALPVVAEGERESALLGEARELLRARPYLAAGIATGDDERELALEATASLRLIVLHHFATPLERGEATADAALRLAEALEAREDALAREAPSALALHHEALRFLHPRPSPRSVEGLPGLLRRLDALPRPRGLLAFLRAKAHQHLQFYRLFFGAPRYAARARRIREKLPRTITALPVALETFGAVEQMGPIVDNFVFDGRGSREPQDAVGVADYGFLYMQIADEIVDSILHHAGPERTLALITRRFMGEDARRAFVPLMDLGEDDLREVGLSSRSLNQKYRATLGELILSLGELRALLEGELDALEPVRREEVRAELSAFFHHCFSTFLDELELLRSRPGARLDRLPLGETLFHFYRKNNLVMMRWLGLRALLLGIDPAEPAARIRAFGYVLSTFQIFDDLKDLAVDLGKQPNYALQIAASAHPRELSRAERSFEGRSDALRVADIPWVNLEMPGTVLACLRLVRLVSRARFSWFEDYVVDLRWRRNWLVRRGNFNDDDAAEGHLEAVLTGRRRRLRLPELARAVIAELTPLRHEASEDELLAYAFDVLAFERRAALCVAALPNLRRVYRILNLSVVMAPIEKAEVMRKVLRSAPAPALESLPRDNPRLGEP